MVQTVVETPNWQAQQFRLTVLTGEDPKSMSLRAEDWWTAVHRSEPQNVRRQPAMNSYIYDRTDEGTQLTLHVAPGRVDWLMQSIAGFADQGIFQPSEQQVVRYFGQWLSQFCPETNRIAVGVKFQHMATSVAEGYRSISSFVPVPLGRGACDFLYQINIPIASTAVPGMALNRLSKWYVELVSSILVSTNGVQQTSDSYRPTLETDFSNVATSHMMSADQRLSIVAELSRAANDVLARGLL